MLFIVATEFKVSANEFSNSNGRSSLEIYGCGSNNRLKVIACRARLYEACLSPLGIEFNLFGSADGEKIGVVRQLAE